MVNSIEVEERVFYLNFWWIQTVKSLRGEIDDDWDAYSLFGTCGEGIVAASVWSPFWLNVAVVPAIII